MNTNQNANLANPSLDGDHSDDSGMTYEEMLAQEDAPLEREMISRNLGARTPIEPAIVAYTERSMKNPTVSITDLIAEPKPIPETTPETITTPEVLVIPEVNRPPKPVEPPKPTLSFDEIAQERIAKNLYYQDKHKKSQIYIHHTVSTGNPMSAINWWRQRQGTVATFSVIAGKPASSRHKYKDGEIFQCFSSADWAYHLGLGKKARARLARKHDIGIGDFGSKMNQRSIGIEICNWGWLTLENDGRFTAAGGKVTIPESEVQEYPDKYRGFRYYEKYTEAQIESTRKLLVYLCESYKIPKTYHEGMFDICVPALKGEPGVWTHTSIRDDKFDCHPQPELVQMLRSL